MVKTEAYVVKGIEFTGSKSKYFLNLSFEDMMAFRGSRKWLPISNEERMELSYLARKAIPQPEIKRRGLYDNLPERS